MLHGVMFFMKIILNGYRKTFRYRGVEERKAYSIFYIFNLAVWCGSAWATFYFFMQMIMHSGIVAQDPSMGTPVFIGFLISPVLFLFSSLSGLASSARRMHDIGKTGWLLLIPVGFALFLPLPGILIKFVFDVVLMFLNSKVSNSEYRLVD